MISLPEVLCFAEVIQRRISKLFCEFLVGLPHTLFILLDEG